MTEEKKPLKIISKFKIEGEVVARNAKHQNVKNKKLKASSKNWVGRHINDEFAHKAKTLGYRARSAFKLIEIEEKYNIFNLGKNYIKGSPPPLSTVLDLGCAPGSWSQVLLNKTNAKVVGVDLLDIAPLEGLDFYKGDFCDPEIQNLLAFKYGKFDLIVSDIAPNTSGNKSVDSLALIDIVEKEWLFLQNFLNKDGCFVCKVFRSGAEAELLKEMKKRFAILKHFKPKSSRKESNEFYVIALKFL